MVPRFPNEAALFRADAPAYLDPLPDGVVRRRPAVLLVVETRPLGRPVGVVLGGGDDLLGGDLPRLHAQRLHTGERWQGRRHHSKSDFQVDVLKANAQTGLLRLGFISWESCKTC